MLQVKNIIGIHGVPRSGTSWLAQILNASPDVNLKFQPLFSYKFKDYLSLNSSKDEIDNFFSEIFKSDDDFINMRDKNLLKDYPIFNKNENPSHLVFKHIRYHYLLEHIINNNQDVKFIFIIRHPLAVLNSWKSIPREFSPEWNFNEEWKEANKKNNYRKEEYFGYYKWKEAVKIFYDLSLKFPEKIYLVKYSDLLETPLETSKAIYDFVDLDFSKQTHNFINESRSKNLNHPNSVYRNRVRDDDFVASIPVDIRINVYNDLKNSFYEQYLTP